MRIPTMQGDIEGAQAALLTAADLAAPQQPAQPAVLTPKQTFPSPPRKAAKGSRRKAEQRSGEAPPDEAVAAVASDTSGSPSSDGGSGSGEDGGATAIRALLSAGSMLARAGRKQEAADAVRRAVALDPRLREKFLDPLEEHAG